jgi:hypothetical protein
MRRAYCVIRPGPHYRREAFYNGLNAAGFRIEASLPHRDPAPGDIMVIWNRYSDQEGAADLWEKRGGTVIVAENGYCGRDGQGRQYYALALHGHNGSGSWPSGGAARWTALGLTVAPWRSTGEHVLVCPNRHFGMRGLAMPQGWEQSAVAELRKYTRRPIRVRPHPNGNAPARSLAADFENCWAVVIWASSCGVHALLAGVPVICTSPWWICKPAAREALSEIERIDAVDSCTRDAARDAALQRMAWAQWTVDEIASGEPFRRLLEQ